MTRLCRSMRSMHELLCRISTPGTQITLKQQSPPSPSEVTLSTPSSFSAYSNSPQYTSYPPLHPTTLPPRPPPSPSHQSPPPHSHPHSPSHSPSRPESHS